MPDGENTYLLSTHPLQDSLKFNTAITTLQLKDFTMQAKKVPYIGVADSRVFPYENKVTIRENADMDELNKAYIIADTANKFHNMHHSDPAYMR